MDGRSIPGRDTKGPREIHLDLGVEQLAQRFDFDKGMGRKYLDLVKIKLQKAFPRAKIRIGMKASGEPAWRISPDDGSALARCREILAEIDRLNQGRV